MYNINIVRMAIDQVNPKTNEREVRARDKIIREKRNSLPVHFNVFNFKENIGTLQTKRNDSTIEIIGMKNSESNNGFIKSLYKEK